LTKSRGYDTIKTKTRRKIHETTETAFNGTILDAMAYISTNDVRPIFFDTTMAQKRMRNEDSIEMLYLIRDSLYFDLGSVYAWTYNITWTAAELLDNSRAVNAASLFEAQLPVSQIAMDNMMELIENQ